MRTTSVRKLLPEAWGMLQPSLTFFFSSSEINVLTPNSDITFNNFLFYNSGFLCPVHTPDGSPCGLLNHMAASCQVNNNGETYSDGWRETLKLVYYYKI